MATHQGYQQCNVPLNVDFTVRQDVVNPQHLSAQPSYLTGILNILVKLADFIPLFKFFGFQTFLTEI